jgi:arabinogalactan endo-1,4-beta-galactosidase
MSGLKRPWHNTHNRPSRNPAGPQRGILAAIVFAGVLAAAANDDFIAGADLSHLAFFENRGITYKDGGATSNALAILGSNGLNCVRLRLFTSSAAPAQSDPYNYTNNLD